MTRNEPTRRTFLVNGAAAGAAFTAGSAGLLLPAGANGLAPTPSMRGGSNNYLPGAPVVDLARQVPGASEIGQPAGQGLGHGSTCHAPPRHGKPALFPLRPGSTPPATTERPSP